MNKKFSKSLCVFLVSIAAVGAFASTAEKRISKKLADRLAIEFTKLTQSAEPQMFQALSLSVQDGSERGGIIERDGNVRDGHAGPFQQPICEPVDKMSCVKILCDKSGDCGYQPNFDDIVSSCRGSSGACVDLLCARTGDCGYRPNGKAIAEGCKGSNDKCVQIGCNKTGDCGYRPNALEIAKACMGLLDDACVEYGCNKTGNCGYRPNFIKIAQSCAGN